tara:strand:- start:159 stop:413 length:255 start_codon:yes stop_codon:yes gene_type:complete
MARAGSAFLFSLFLCLAASFILHDVNENVVVDEQYAKYILDREALMVKQRNMSFVNVTLTEREKKADEILIAMRKEELKAMGEN